MVFSQVYHDLLHSEEEFVSLLRSAVDDFIKVLPIPLIHQLG